jgi:eukaryotic-like serine/threonine-protein kinase
VSHKQRDRSAAQERQVGGRVSDLGLTVECDECGSINRSTAKFCGNCGGRLSYEVLCPDCETPNLAGQVYCDECGRNLRSVASASTADVPRPVARAIAGRYDLVRLVGEGGRKRVYLANDRHLGREVALAIFKADSGDAAALARARHEAEAMARLDDHPNVVNVYDIGEEAGQLYLVSHYMSGGDLYGLMAEAEDRRFAVSEVVRIGSEVAAALEHAHAHGVIHRDIKPHNVWLAPDGTAKLGDFGLAVSSAGSRLTTEGTVVGTVAYMCPEQGLGRRADERSDIYSLGALLYELLCGVPPFVGDDAAAVIAQHLSTAPVGPSWHRAEVPRPLEQLILKMLAKSPDERPQSATEVRGVLEQIDSAPVAGEAAPAGEATALARLTSGTLIGRETEAEHLRGAVDEGVAQRGRLVLLGGETGIGKTRLAAEVESYAGLRGAQVLWGRCYHHDGAPAYWLWVQVIRAYVHAHDPDTLISDLGTGASEIAQIVTELRDRFPELPKPQPLDPEQARFRLLDSVSTFLVNAANRRPLAICLEDIHLADTPSLQLLEFLARRLTGARVFVLATYRDDDPERADVISELRTSLSRERGYTHLKLRGLAPPHVKAMLEGILQQPLDSTRELAVVDAIQEESDGNPYFIEETVRHLIDSGAIRQSDGRWTTDARDIRELGIPHGVRAAVAGRLSRLSDDSRELLQTAAAIGQEFRLETLATVTGLRRPAVVERLQEAVDGAVIRATGDRYAFAHSTTRESLYEDLQPARRMQLHQKIGESLEQLYGNRIASRLGEVAHHLVKAAPIGDAGKAGDYARRAGERAAALYAYEEAAAHFLNAIQLSDSVAADPLRRGGLLLALADARRRAGDVENAKATFLEAAALGQSLNLSEQYASAALGYGAGPGGFSPTSQGDETLITLLRGALEALPGGDSALKVRVMARLAVELSYSGELTEPDALSTCAVEMAERLADTSLVELALYSRQWSVMGPDTIEDHLAASEEIVRVASAAGDRDMEFAGHHLRLIALLQLGRLDAVDRQIVACDKLADELRQPDYLWWVAVFRTMRALVQGRFAEAERLSHAALSLGQRGQEELANVVFGAQSFMIKWGAGGLEELVETGRTFADRYGQAWRTATIWLLTETGHIEEARARFRALADVDFTTLRPNGEWLTAICGLALASVSLSEHEAAETLYQLLLPYADRYTGFLAGAGFLGSNHAYLGFAAKAAGRLDDAVDHFEQALERNAAIGAHYVTPRVHGELAATLVLRDAPGDRGRAAQLAESGVELARKLGMRAEVERLMTSRLEERGARGIDLTSSIEAVAISVEHDRPDLAPVAAPDGTVTIMFSDIEASTHLTERLGDPAWLALLRRHDRIVRRQLMAHGGFEVKSQGDGFMMAFGSARSAVHCAIAIQAEFTHYRERHPGEPLHVRIGLHTGEVVRERDDFYGKNVILAARIAGQARGDEILVSALLRELVSSTREFVFADERELELKGLSGSHLVYCVRWQEAAVPTLAPHGA